MNKKNIAVALCFENISTLMNGQFESMEEVLKDVKDAIAGLDEPANGDLGELTLVMISAQDDETQDTIDEANLLGQILEHWFGPSLAKLAMSGNVEVGMTVYLYNPGQAGIVGRVIDFDTETCDEPYIGVEWLNEDGDVIAGSAGGPEMFTSVFDYPML
jgi:hypothetical protein